MGMPHGQCPGSVPLRNAGASLGPPHAGQPRVKGAALWSVANRSPGRDKPLPLHCPTRPPHKTKGRRIGTLPHRSKPNQGAGDKHTSRPRLHSAATYCAQNATITSMITSYTTANLPCFKAPHLSGTISAQCGTDGDKDGNWTFALT